METNSVCTAVKFHKCSLIDDYKLFSSHIKSFKNFKILVINKCQNFPESLNYQKNNLIVKL